MRRSKEATMKYISEAKRVYKYYMDMPVEEFSHVHVSVSLGNSKIGKCLNVSLLPFLTCEHFEDCICTCYAISSALRFPDTLNAWAKNTAIATRDLPRFFEEIEEAINHHPSYRSFRWHVAGDIPSVTYYNEMTRTAERHSERTFWSYTKKPQYLRMARPNNFNIQKSTGFGVAFNPAESGQFHCVRAGQTPPEGVMQCGGNCAYCVAHGVGCPVGQNVWTYEH